MVKIFTSQIVLFIDKFVGINLEDFKEAMLRIAIKGKNIFNKFAESAAKGALNQSAMQ